MKLDSRKLSHLSVDLRPCAHSIHRGAARHCVMALAESATCQELGLARLRDRRLARDGLDACSERNLLSLGMRYRDDVERLATDVQFDASPRAHFMLHEFSCAPTRCWYPVCFNVAVTALTSVINVSLLHQWQHSQFVARRAMTRAPFRRHECFERIIDVANSSYSSTSLM